MMLGDGRAIVDCREAWSLPILRVPAGSRFRVVMQSPYPLWFATHWVRKQVMCCGDGCELCSMLSSRTHGYFVGSLDEASTMRPVLVEVTAGSWQLPLSLLDDDESESLAGRVLHLSRKRKRSPLHLDCRLESGRLWPRLQAWPTLVNALAVLYGLPRLQTDEAPADWGTRVRSHARNQAMVAWREISGGV